VARIAERRAPTSVRRRSSRWPGCTRRSRRALPRASATPRGGWRRWID